MPDDNIVTFRELTKIMKASEGENREQRHVMKGVMQNILLDIARLTEGTTRTNDDLGKVIKGMDNIHKKFDNLPKSFATQDEHNNHSERIQSIENGIKWAIGFVAASIIGAILKLILI